MTVFTSYQQPFSAGHSDRSNNFDFLRFLAAMMVIVGHSFTLLGQPSIALFGKPLAHMGVIIFFSVSGYLIADSWQRDPSVGRFLARRALRIFPALIVVVVISAVAVGPLMTSLPLETYFNHSQFFDYFLNIVLSPRYNLPAVFLDNPYPNAVNGSLWSLAPEFACYLAIVLLGLIFRRHLAWPIAFAFVALAIVNVSPRGSLVVFGSDIFQASDVSVYFAAGALVRCRSIPLRSDVGLLFLLGASIASAINFDFVAMFAWDIALPYVILWLGLQRWPVVGAWGRFGDPSYGMYLYAFPIQQTLAHVTNGTIALPVMILATGALSAGAGYLSWMLVERPALRYRPRVDKGTSSAKGTRAVDASRTLTTGQVGPNK